MMLRRKFIYFLFLLSSGCIGQSRDRIESSSVWIKNEVVSETEYIEVDARSSQLSEQINIDGKIYDVSVLNHAAFYSSGIGFFAVISTPKIEIQERIINSLDLSTTRLTNRCLALHINNIEKIDTFQAEILGKKSKTNKYTTQKQEKTSIYKTDIVDYKTDFVLALAKHPYNDKDEQEKILRLIEGIQHI